MTKKVSKRGGIVIDRFIGTVKASLRMSPFMNHL